MRQTWIDSGTQIGTPDPWWTRSGKCWGEIGRVTDDNPRKAPRAHAIEYLVDGQWLTTSAIAAHPKNTRKLGQKGVQSRIDRVKAMGYNPAARRHGELLGKATITLSWPDFTRSAERGKHNAGQPFRLAITIAWRMNGWWAVTTIWATPTQTIFKRRSHPTRYPCIGSTKKTGNQHDCTTKDARFLH